MRHLTFVICLLLLLPQSIIAQSCLPEGLVLPTQEEIDNFQTNNPGCTVIEGDVWIRGDIDNLNGLNVLTAIEGYLWINSTDLINLTGLENIQSIGGYLSIDNNHSLIGIEGLTSLISIGGYLSIYHNSKQTSLTGLGNDISLGGSLEIGANDSLTSLIGLNNIISIGGNITIRKNYALTNLVGLENVTAVNGNLSIHGNYSLSSLTGLENLTEISGHLAVGVYSSILEELWGNPSLVSLSGLNNLLSIGGSLSIQGNSKLDNIIGISNLTTMNGDLNIAFNDSLTSLIGLDNITEGLLSNLYIHDNLSLSNCEIQFICDYLAAPQGTINIYNNDSGCGNPPEVASSCDVTLSCLPYGNYCLASQNDIDEFQNHYPGCNDLAGNLRISGDDISNLNGLAVLTSIEGDLLIFENPSLLTLVGPSMLNTIGGDLILYRNHSLVSLVGLGKLNTVTGLYIGYYIWGFIGNYSLTSLIGIDNVDASSLEYLTIMGNVSLSSCEIKSVCDFLAIPNNIAEITHNAPGCNGMKEVQEACDGVGVKSLNPEKVISVYPNPANTQLTMSSKYVLLIDEVIIYNQTGQIVLHQQPANNTINISYLRPGMYFVEVVAGQRRIREKFIIK